MSMSPMQGAALLLTLLVNILICTPTGSQAETGNSDRGASRGHLQLSLRASLGGEHDGKAAPAAEAAGAAQQQPDELSVEDLIIDQEARCPSNPLPDYSQGCLSCWLLVGNGLVCFACTEYIAKKCTCAACL